MTTWRVPLPGGHVYEIDTPDDVAKEDVQAYAEAHHLLTCAYDVSNKGHQDRIDALFNPMADGAQAGSMSALKLFQGPSAFLDHLNSQP